tara:strand:+ start:3146 stop:3757 length:612 start_codon:yes stop_codon:yes gene_type:complete
MNQSSDLTPSLNSLFEDLNHPNPNINIKAYIKMNEYWPEESMERLINNLDSKDIILRRKSIKALGCFGEKVLLPVSNLFFKSKDIVSRVSCLKILVLVASDINLQSLRPEVMDIIQLALNDDSAEMILTLVSFLKQIGSIGIPLLKNCCRDVNVLRARASVTAIGEINEPCIKKFLRELMEDNSVDIMVREAARESLGVGINL